MPTHVFDPVVTQVIQRAQAAARLRATKTVDVQGTPRPDRFPSPGDWRDNRIYFLLIDRFSNKREPPRGA